MLSAFCVLRSLTLNCTDFVTGHGEIEENGLPLTSLPLSIHLEEDADYI